MMAVQAPMSVNRISKVPFRVVWSGKSPRLVAIAGGFFIYVWCLARNGHDYQDYGGNDVAIVYILHLSFWCVSLRTKTIITP